MGDITQLLDAVRSGDAAAADRLLQRVYNELNKLAAAAMKHETAQTLSPSGLVHEAYLRLADPEGILPFENRRHFFGAAALAMRRILVDAARSRARNKRRGAQQRIELPDLPADQPDSQLLALDDPPLAEIVNLHHFAGLSHENVADILGLTVYEVRAKWTFARAWLRDAIT